MKAVLEIDSANEGEAKALLGSLKQEEEFEKRSKININLKGKKLLVEVEAKDFIALRASVVSLLRLIAVAQEI